jgi:hypothetical protein
MESIPVEVFNSSGHWCRGFKLLAFNADGTVSIRSDRTGVTRNLDRLQWRDPVELEVLLLEARK